jgi:hypothetical protein
LEYFLRKCRYARGTSSKNILFNARKYPKSESRGKTPALPFGYFLVFENAVMPQQAIHHAPKN